MLIDLDGFKEVNDTLGHHTGDAVLPGRGQRLAPLSAPNNLVARLGGDEFSVLLRTRPRTRPSPCMADQVVDLISQPFGVEGPPARHAGQHGRGRVRPRSARTPPA